MILILVIIGCIAANAIPTDAIKVEGRTLGLLTGLTREYPPNLSGKYGYGQGYGFPQNQFGTYQPHPTGQYPPGPFPPGPYPPVPYPPGPYPPSPYPSGPYPLLPYPPGPFPLYPPGYSGHSDFRYPGHSGYQGFHGYPAANGYLANHGSPGYPELPQYPIYPHYSSYPRYPTNPGYFGSQGYPPVFPSGP